MTHTLTALTDQLNKKDLQLAEQIAKNKSIAKELEQLRMDEDLAKRLEQIYVDEQMAKRLSSNEKFNTELKTKETQRLVSAQGAAKFTITNRDHVLKIHGNHCGCGNEATYNNNHLVKIHEQNCSCDKVLVHLHDARCCTINHVHNHTCKCRGILGGARTLL